MKKRLKIYLFHFLCLMGLEGLFETILFDHYMRTTLFSILFFILPISLFISIITQLFKRKINLILGIVFYGFLGFWFSLEYIYNRVFQTFFSISLFKLSDQVLAFGGETILAIFKNLPFVLLFFIPLILFILLRNQLIIERLNKKELFLMVLSFILSFVPYQLYIHSFDEDSLTYRLIYKMNDNIQNIQNLGVLNATRLDVFRTIVGFEEEITVIAPSQDQNEIFKYDANILEIDFSQGSDSTINNYMEQDPGTSKNRYTGIFEGKNIIYITAESFHPAGVSKEVTPTLHQLVNNGFVFENFYAPYNTSTLGGEFQAITGLYANQEVLSQWREGTNSFPMGLAHMFKKEGYDTFAYHNHNYNFQDRHKYLKSLGFNNYIACFNGLESKINCNRWPESDIEMMDVTTNDYMNRSNPFLAYYMTVSGHLEYTKYDNSIVSKNWNLVKDLPYNDEIKSYFATQIELDKALELLIQRLEENNLLQDTVIVLMADHYPYGLKQENIETLVGHPLDSVELHHSNLVIWNSEIRTQKIDKPCMSIDVIPTVYNLFGFDYDSRLFMGKDIFSSTEGLVIINDRSWVTSKGTYYASTGNFIPKNGEIDQDYIKNTNQIVNNRLNISKKIIESDYYRILKK